MPPVNEHAIRDYLQLEAERAALQPTPKICTLSAVQPAVDAAGKSQRENPRYGDIPEAKSTKRSTN